MSRAYSKSTTKYFKDMRFDVKSLDIFITTKYYTKYRYIIVFRLGVLNLSK